MTTSISLYNHTRRLVASGAVDLDSDSIKAILVTSAYVFDANHVMYTTPKAFELPSGAGYTAGGLDLTGLSTIGVGANAKLVADNLVWPLLTGTFRAAILYDDTYDRPEPVYGSPVSDYRAILAYILLDTTPADVVVNNTDYSIQWNPAGILTFS